MNRPDARPTRSAPRRPMWWQAAAGVLLLLAMPSAQAAVLVVLAGDQVLLDGEPAALADIDAPEPCQPGGHEARRALATLLHGELTYEVAGHDDGGHPRLRLFADGREVNQNLVQLGWAWDVTRQAPSRYAFAQAVAKMERQGLWADASPMPPWQWRATTPRICGLTTPGSARALGPVVGAADA